MPTIIVTEELYFSCDGIGHCGGTDYKDSQIVKRCHHCEYCDSFKRDKGRLKVVMENGKQYQKTNLKRWFK